MKLRIGLDEGTFNSIETGTFRTWPIVEFLTYKMLHNMIGPTVAHGP